MGIRAFVDRQRARNVMPQSPDVEVRTSEDRSAVSADDILWLYLELLDRHPVPAEIAFHCHHSATLRDVLKAVFSTEERYLQVRARRDLASRAFVTNLQLLNDTLAQSPVADRYWVWGGLLIGWARDGLTLAHDSADADFCVRREDLPLFAVAARALIGAGFAPLYRHVNSAGRATEFTFWRDGAKFEFFLMDCVGEQLYYYEFGAGAEGEGPIEALAAIPAQPLVAFEFLDRTWLKHNDHDAELTTMYGEWRVPRPEWYYMDDRAIVSRTVWTRSDDRAWAGSFDIDRDG